MSALRDLFSEDTKLAALRAVIVLFPSYSMAWLTDKMVYVVPTLAAASFFAAGLGTSDRRIAQRVDDDTDSDTGGEVVEESTQGTFDGNSD